MILQDIKETKHYEHTHTHTHTHCRKDGQCQNSISTHKHSLRGYNKAVVAVIYVAAVAFTDAAVAAVTFTAVASCCSCSCQ